MDRRTIGFIAALLGFLAVFAFKDVLIAPPAPPQVAAAGEFDTPRAFARLQRILAGEPPHPVDTVGSDIVRERLLAEMRAVGLQPRVSDDMVCNDFKGSRSVNCARVRNLAATIGPAEGEHLLFVAHYDSVSVGPGASDDGIGIAAMLEIAEQLRGRPLTRPVTFLFNEGEENGLLGARAFLERDPAAARVTHLVNLEARGVNGPAIMFETSRPNEAAVDFYKAAVGRPVANSLSTDFYRLLPNSTDVTVFEERPWTILNIAIIGNETRYHSAGDNLEALSHSSLFHMGSQALQLANHYVSAEPPVGAGELVYADVVSRVLITMPLVVALVLLGVALLLLGYALIRRRAFGRPLLACLAGFAGAAVMAWAATTLMQMIRPGEYWRAHPWANYLAIAATALLACQLGLLLASRATREQLRVASWFLFVVTGCAICWVAPGGAIFFLAPPLVVLAGVLAARWWPVAEQWAAWLAVLIQLLTLFPVVALVELLLSTSPGWIVGPLVTMVALPFLIELGAEETRPTAVLAPLAAAAVAWAAVSLLPAYSEDRQRIFTIEHFSDARTRRAQWGVYDDGGPLPDSYDSNGPWRRTGVSYARRDRWVADASWEEMPTPRLVKVGDRQVAGRDASQGGRLVTLRAEMNGWDRFDLQLPEAARARSVRLNGRAVTFGDGQGSGPASFRCTGRSCDGLTFDLVVGNAQPVDATLISSVARLPASAAFLVERRPEHARPQYVPDASYALTPVGF